VAKKEAWQDCVTHDRSTLGSVLRTKARLPRLLMSKDFGRHACTIAGVAPVLISITP
jgi:hypothetical protein